MNQQPKAAPFHDREPNGQQRFRRAMRELKEGTALDSDGRPLERVDVPDATRMNEVIRDSIRRTPDDELALQKLRAEGSK